MRARLLLLLLLAAVPLSAQTGGVVGRVLDATSSRPVVGATIRLANTPYTVLTGLQGYYQLRGIPLGWYRVEVVQFGYRPATRDSVRIGSQDLIQLDVRLVPDAVQLVDLSVTGILDPMLDPLSTTTQQRIQSEDFRRLPVASLADAVALQPGVVGESWRGGRQGQQALLLDGLGIKNQFDASTSQIGLLVPPAIVEEAAVITNAFSARYGQSVSGLLSVTTRDGGPVWRGRIAYETDRPMTGGADLGLDRLVLAGDGPLGQHIRLLGILDASGRLDADPVHAPPPSNPGDPRTTHRGPLPNSAGEQWTIGGKMTVVTAPLTSRLLVLTSRDQRLLHDPRYKYDPEFGPGQRVDGTLVSGSFDLTPTSAKRSLQGALRIGYYQRDFARGAVDPVAQRFGAFTGRRFSIRGEEIARAQDTVLTRGTVPGFEIMPTFSDRTPWGVPAFFLGGAPSGEISWNHFSEWRSQLDGSVPIADPVDLLIGGIVVRQEARSFQRVLAHLPVGGEVPPPVVASLSPTITGAYAEFAGRLGDLGINTGIRFDGFSPGGGVGSERLKAHTRFSPRIAISTALPNASIVASIGRFSQPPDIQYLIDAAFDDTLRTGRFRKGNPNLGFEDATQFELNARLRLHPNVTLQSGLYYRKLTGLVSSIPLHVSPDSSQFINADNGDVQGLELVLTLERRQGVRARLSAVYQRAMASVPDAFAIHHLIILDPVTGDTIPAPRHQYPLDTDRRVSVALLVDAELGSTAGPRIGGLRPLAGMIVAAVGRFHTGLPYSRTTTDGRAIVGAINGHRLPSQQTVDLLIRRPLTLGAMQGSLYLDIRNLLHRQNIVSVRRDTGTPFLSDTAIEELAREAYRVNPAPIPWESARYRPIGDPDGIGRMQGEANLLPLFRAAAEDVSAPLFHYGAPRLMRFGLEVIF